MVRRAIAGTESGSGQFFEEFLSFADRIRRVESWQDQLPRNLSSSAQGAPSRPLQGTADLTKTRIRADSFSKSGSGKISSYNTKMPPPQEAQAKNTNRKQELGGGISQSDMPARLQNIFNAAPKVQKGLSRAETDLLTLQAYAPNWRPPTQQVLSFTSSATKIQPLPPQHTP